jgi:soluble lytic murein transglycosylase
LAGAVNTNALAETGDVKGDQREHGSVFAARQGERDAPLLTVAGQALPIVPRDLAIVKQALELIGREKLVDATALEKGTVDPAVQKLIEWALLRRTGSGVGFQRYSAFIGANPTWPSIPLFRSRAEAMLWKEPVGAAEARSFFDGRPVSVVGRLVLARLLLAQGNRAEAAHEVRSVWRSAPLSGELEAAVLGEFPDALTRSDHLARLDQRIGAKDFGAAMRVARRLGDDQVAIVNACTTAAENLASAGKLLDAVPLRARDDLAYALCRVQWLLRNDSPGFNVHGRIVTPKEDIAFAVRLMLSASQESLRQQDADAWWRESRALARKLLDLGDASNAYRVVTNAPVPASALYRAEFHFMAGWIALRFLGDPTTASKHFALVDKGATDPRILARAAYWRGRAAEAAGEMSEMRAQYEGASRYSTAYYGQLARQRLGPSNLAMRLFDQATDPTESEILRAASILYAIGERDLALTFATDVAKESDDTALIERLAKLITQYHDAHATLLIGEAALARGKVMEQYAFPDFGVPSYTAIGPAIDRCVVYSIVRTESAFDQRGRSLANAVGLMQVTPGAGRDIAKRLHVSYDWVRLASDPAYNTEIGAAELAALLQEYGGSYILTFAAYNAGRGRVKQWMGLHGDPRDPRIDPVDWVERIPFAETRNYVQRVMENLQVYRKRVGS